eukprot:CAMPEP_0185199420 /NCGR_PEP_ID=MMETSP1140-20130426/45057_1 /TAXON_ID=298111 /ORGANISM="Pavlova sp., Strain CCMP459" /LENGTH=367 /DNA_ID=CAMNT_0027766691 /DNA_START=123 /DNA_END=1223 /DNA_ORIENTATION=-
MYAPWRWGPGRLAGRASQAIDRAWSAHAPHAHDLERSRRLRSRNALTRNAPATHHPSPVRPRCRDPRGYWSGVHHWVQGGVVGSWKSQGQVVRSGGALEGERTASPMHRHVTRLHRQQHPLVSAEAQSTARQEPLACEALASVSFPEPEAELKEKAMPPPIPPSTALDEALVAGLTGNAPPPATGVGGGSVPTLAPRRNERAALAGGALPSGLGSPARDATGRLWPHPVSPALVRKPKPPAAPPAPALVEAACGGTEAAGLRAVKGAVDEARAGRRGAEGVTIALGHTCGNAPSHPSSELVAVTPRWRGHALARARGRAVAGATAISAATRAGQGRWLVRCRHVDDHPVHLGMRHIPLPGDLHSRPQ